MVNFDKIRFEDYCIYWPNSFLWLKYILFTSKRFPGFSILHVDNYLCYEENENKVRWTESRVKSNHAINILKKGNIYIYILYIFTLNFSNISGALRMPLTCCIYCLKFYVDFITANLHILPITCEWLMCLSTITTAYRTVSLNQKQYFNAACVFNKMWSSEAVPGYIDLIHYWKIFWYRLNETYHSSDYLDLGPLLAYCLIRWNTPDQHELLHFGGIC